MTNAHVVSDTALLLVYFHNDPRPYPAKVTAIAHECDLALLELLFDDAVRLTKRATWRFSRRQRNWFSQEAGVDWLLVDQTLAQRAHQRVTGWLEQQAEAGVDYFVGEPYS